MSEEDEEDREANLPDLIADEVQSSTDDSSYDFKMQARQDQLFRDTLSLRTRLRDQDLSEEDLDKATERFLVGKLQEADELLPIVDVSVRSVMNHVLEIERFRAPKVDRVNKSKVSEEQESIVGTVKPSKAGKKGYSLVVTIPKLARDRLGIDDKSILSVTIDEKGRLIYELQKLKRK